MIRLLFLAFLLVCGISVLERVGGGATAEKFGHLISRTVAKVDGDAVVTWVDDFRSEIPWRRIKKTTKNLAEELARHAD